MRAAVLPAAVLASGSGAALAPRFPAGTVPVRPPFPRAALRFPRRHRRHRLAPRAPHARCTRLVRRSPTDAIARLRLGVFNLRLAELGTERDAIAAVKTLRRVTERQPAWPLAWYALGLAEARRAAWEQDNRLALGSRVGQGTLERAADRQRRALEADPAYAPAALGACGPDARPSRYRALPAGRANAAAGRAPAAPRPAGAARLGTAGAGRGAARLGAQSRSSTISRRAATARSACWSWPAPAWAPGTPTAPTAYYRGAELDDSAATAGYRADLAAGRRRLGAEPVRRRGGTGAGRIPPALLDRPRPARDARRGRAAAGALSPPAIRPAELRPHGQPSLLRPGGRVSLGRRWSSTTAASSTSGTASPRTGCAPSSSASCPTSRGGSTGPKATSCSTSAPATTPTAAAISTTTAWWRACWTCAARATRRGPAAALAPVALQPVQPDAQLGPLRGGRSSARERGIGQASIAIGTTTDSHELRSPAPLGAVADLVAVGATRRRHDSATSCSPWPSPGPRPAGWERNQLPDPRARRGERSERPAARRRRHHDRLPARRAAGPRPVS